MPEQLPYSDRELLQDPRIARLIQRAARVQKEKRTRKISKMNNSKQKLINYNIMITL